MATYVLFGKYSAGALKSATEARTAEAESVIRRNGGELTAAYCLLGDPDLVLIVEMADTKAALKVSVALSKTTGIGFRTAPAVGVKEFDALLGEL